MDRRAKMKQQDRQRDEIRQGTEARDRYALQFVNDLDRQAKWLELSATQKVESIVRLLEKLPAPDGMLELGCGTGAVIAECARRKLANRFAAADWSAIALGQLRATDLNIATLQMDLEAAFVLPDGYETVILSHVIEHLANPAVALSRLRQQGITQLIAEVPLEGLPLARLKHLFRDPRKNSAGHLQFFTARSFRSLMKSAGWVIVDEKRSVPVLPLSTVRFLREKDRLGLALFAKTVLTANVLPRMARRLWGSLYYAHFAVACRLERF